MNTDSNITTNMTSKYKSKEKMVLPKGSVVESKEVSIEVEEIENGYLVCKRIEVKYKVKDKEYSDWKSCTKKYFSETNPIKIDTKDKALADMFTDEIDY